VITAAILLGGGGGGGYPTDLPNLGNRAFHYIAGVGTSESGGKVDSWNDQAGSNHLGNAGRPVRIPAGLNGEDYITWASADGADGSALLYKDGSTLPGATHTWAAVFRRRTTSPGVQKYFSFYGGAAFGIDSTKWAATTSDVYLSAGDHDGSWHIVVGRRASGSLDVALDGPVIVSGVTNTVTSNSGRILIGGWISGSGDNGDFDLAEYVGYNSAEDVDEIGGYFAGKYALTWP
jgi:hypothetical protein